MKAVCIKESLLFSTLGVAILRKLLFETIREAVKGRNFDGGTLLKLLTNTECWEMGRQNKDFFKDRLENLKKRFRSGENVIGVASIYFQTVEDCLSLHHLENSEVVEMRFTKQDLQDILQRQWGILQAELSEAEFAQEVLKE